ncbi:MAG: CDC27 family protein [Chitinophagales bacterium]|nr:CDC27 family protein [Chitinophagales bacterium]
MAYERKQYAVATEMLAKEFAKSSVPRAKARLAYLTGLSHYKLLEYKLAKKWLAEAVQLEYGSEALTHYAKVSKNLQEYTDAISAYEQIGKITGRNQETDREIQICRMAMEAITNPEPYTIEKVSQNSAVSEYSPIIYDNVYLVFTSERRASTGSSVYKWTGEKFSDFFIMMKSG